MGTYNIPGPNGVVSLDVSPGRPLFVVGRNGTGKSALIHTLLQQSMGRSVYLPGSRTAVFDGEGLSLTASSRKGLSSNLLSWDNSPDVRWRNISGNARNEKAVHDLTAEEVQYKSDIANEISQGVDVEKNIEKLKLKLSPLDRVNIILQQSNIFVRVAISNGDLSAKSGDKTYSFARMSDGERIALILIAEVVSAKPNAVLLIDEPELHLHRSIVVPLISSLVKTRSDCEFIISTHELELPASLSQSRVCIVRSAKWDPGGSVEHWDIDTFENPEEIPDEIRIDILGSRRKVLFTEGSDTSLDIPMYSILFSQASVRSKNGCREVHRAVSGVRSTAQLHHSEAYGLVDNDGMSIETIAEYQRQGVYPLPIFSVESLYYASELVEAVAQRQAATMAIKDDDRRNIYASYMADVISGVISAASITGKAEHLAARLAERQMRDFFISQFPSRDELIAATSSIINISASSLYPAELARIQSMIQSKDVFGIISRYPVRHSGILNAVAKALKFQNRADYEAAALTRVSSDETLREKILSKLNPLAELLNT